jgi:hypothetical protein
MQALHFMARSPNSNVYFRFLEISRSWRRGTGRRAPRRAATMAFTRGMRAASGRWLEVDLLGLFLGHYWRLVNNSISSSDHFQNQLIYIGFTFIRQIY